MVTLFLADADLAAAAVRQVLHVRKKLQWRRRSARQALQLRHWSFFEFHDIFYASSIADPLDPGASGGSRDHVVLVAVEDVASERDASFTEIITFSTDHLAIQGHRPLAHDATAEDLEDLLRVMCSKIFTGESKKRDLDGKGMPTGHAS